MNDAVSSAIVGTFVERRTEQFIKSRASKKTDIDDLGRHSIDISNFGWKLWDRFWDMS